MPTVSWPTVVDYVDFLNTANLSVKSEGQAQLALDAAKEKFECDVNLTPFLVEDYTDDTPDETTWYYTPTQNLVMLDGGFVSITGVKTGVTWTQGAVDGSSGTSVYQHNDYRAYHLPDNQGPICALKFHNYLFGGYGYDTISVTGVRGAYLSLPKDVFLAVMQIAAAMQVSMLNWAGSGNISEFAIGNNDLRVKFQSGKGELAMSMDDVAKSCIERYKRRSL